MGKIFNHPVSHNIQWHDVLSLLQNVAAVTEEPGGRYTVTLGSETQTFDAPRHRRVWIVKEAAGYGGNLPGSDEKRTVRAQGQCVLRRFRSQTNPAKNREGPRFCCGGPAPTSCGSRPRLSCVSPVGS